MSTQQAQIKINLPAPIKNYLEDKANNFGVTTTIYIKHLFIREMEDEQKIPVYKASARTEKRAIKALENIDKAVKVVDIKKFVDNL